MMDIQAMKDEHACDLALAELAAADRYLNELTFQSRNLRRQARRGRAAEVASARALDLVSALRASVNAADDLLKGVFFEVDIPVHESDDRVDARASADREVVVELVVPGFGDGGDLGLGSVFVEPVNDFAVSGNPLSVNAIVIPAAIAFADQAGNVRHDSQCLNTCPHGDSVNDDADSFKDSVAFHDSSSLVGGCARRCAQGCCGSQPTGEESSREGSEQ